MINIEHPKVSSKPPIKKCPSERRNAKNIDTFDEQVAEDFSSSVQKTDVSNISTEENYVKEDATLLEVDTIIRNIEHNVKKLQSTNDCNHNIIEPNSCSFEQLCSMINDLEQNTTDCKAMFNKDTNDLNVYTECDVSETNILLQKYSNQVEPEKDYSRNVRTSSESTYNEIMSFLGTLEQNGYLDETKINESKMHSKSTVQDYFSNNQCHYCHNHRNDAAIIRVPDTLKDDLATAQLQLEERDATINFLKNELKTERQSACEKLESQKKQQTTELQGQKIKYQGIIKRHQKFIEQLISEKKDLSEKCNALTECIKEMEVKQQRELKVTAERHAVELQRARELCAASEKIRRERWLEAKTSKIKEMTVKGLEPELRNMMEQHQQEVQQIRSAHMNELQDIELRTIRRSNQQLEQLRLELTASHEKTLANEKEILRTRYQEKLEEQETLFQTQQKKLFDEVQRERKTLIQEQTKKDAERDATVQQACSEFHEKINMLNRQHQIEKKTFQESLAIEHETWMENYRRQQNTKLAKAETKIRDECNRERDKQIELAIERLERETRDMKANLQQSSNNKLRCLKEKYEAELQDVSNSEELLKAKVASIQERFNDIESQFQKTESRLQQCTADLNNSNLLVEKLTMERDNAKKIVRLEIESEKTELKDKIASLHREMTENNSNRNALMTQLYSRVKLIISQKDLMITNLAKENNDMKKKYDHLEKLLDQQRREYILKSL